MKQFIKVLNSNLFLLNKELLGVNEAQLWIGPNPDGPLDNDDQRVLAERAQAEADKNLPGKRISGIEAVTLHESESYPGWFEVSTIDWQSGTYRFNIHGLANIQTPLGTPLRPIRDGQYSWPNFSDESCKIYQMNKNNFCI
ncbi:hypothetical protein IT409_01860 [Candidatus Falkowbacteria bacterium]|nr:hypothetical protein [Candidatus Falkowbacteria bacterium]